MDTISKPAVVVAGYNRLESLKRVLRSLSEADYVDNDIPLVISLDKSEKTGVLRDAAEKFKWEYGNKEIRVFEERQGLRKHILSCGDLSFQYGAVIILEDDIVVGKGFYHYAKEALNFYKSEKKIAGIALYSHKYNGYANKPFEPIHNGYDVFFAHFSISWGQCWSSQQWKCFKEWYAQNNGDLSEREDIPHQITNWPASSWGKYFAHYIVENDKYYVIPFESHSTCFSDVGQHTGVSNSVGQVPLTSGKRSYNFASYEEAEKYDIYMENMDLGNRLDEKYTEEGICINLSGQKPSFLGNRYMLTMNQMNYRIVQSFGLKMYPPELNILFNVPGKDIFLYDSAHKAKNTFKNQKLRILDYEMRWVKSKEALCFVAREIMRKFLKK